MLVLWTTTVGNTHVHHVQYNIYSPVHSALQTYYHGNRADHVSKLLTEIIIPKNAKQVCILYMYMYVDVLVSLPWFSFYLCSLLLM